MAIMVGVALVAGIPSPGSAVLGAALPGHSESGTLGQAAYRFEMPPQWQGTLLVYMHGYTDRGEGAEADGFTPILAPSAASLEDGALEDALLLKGYALAGSAYSQNGWAVDAAFTDTQALVRHTEATIAANPAWGTHQRTVVMACSMGTLAAYRMAQAPHPVADAFVTLGGVGAGTAFADHTLAFQLAYATAFGWPASWGRPGDVRNAGDDPAHPEDLDFEDEAAAVMAAQIADPTQKGRWEFVRSVTGIPTEGWDGGQDLPWWVVMGAAATEFSAEWEARYGGSPAQTVHHDYSLDAAGRERIARLDPTLDVDALLAAMDGADLAANVDARRLMAEESDPTGRLRAPLLAMHSQSDGIVPSFLEAQYGSLVDRAHRDENLVQQYTAQPSHCTFTLPQILTALEAAEDWADGTRPTADLFRARAGFLPGHQPAGSPY